MEASNRIPHLPIHVDENDLIKGARRILKSIRATWRQDELQFRLLTDGITNKLIAGNVENGPEEETILIRVYGNKTDLLIDRKAEKRNILLLHREGLATQLYATFENGLAYAFVPGRPLTAKTVTQPEIYGLVAKHLAKMHKVKVEPPSSHPIFWDKLDKFFRLVPERFTDNSKHKRFEELIVPRSQIEQEINFLREKLTKLNSPVVFAHNDLLLGNVIYTAENKSVSFIDFEYSAMNYQAYDIGNHFAEFVGISNVDFSNYPNKELQWNWLKMYLSTLQDDENVSDRDIHKLYVQVNQFALAAHVFWGVWSLIQAEHSSNDFDYIQYASIKFKEYFAKKHAFLALDYPR